MIESTRDINKVSSGRLGFVFTLLYLIFEYGRPQDQISALTAVRPGLILIAILAIILLFSLPRLKRTASRQTFCLILFLVLMAIHVPIAENNGRAFSTTQGFLINAIVCLSIMTFVDTPERLRTLLKFWILLMTYIAVNGILGAGAAGSNFLEDENDFALLMNMMLPFGIFLSFYEQKTKSKLLYVIPSLLCLASVVASFSRGGFIGLSVVAIAVWLASPRKFVMLVAGVTIAVIVMNLPITHPGTTVAGSTYWEEMNTINTEPGQDYNKDSRLELWKSAWHMFLDYPFGVGPQNFPVRLPEYQTEYFSDRSMWGKAAHSIWFTLLPELGIPGFLIFFILLFANVRDIRYLKRQLPEMGDLHRLVHFLSLAYATSLVGYFVSATFLSALYYPHYWYLTAMIVATRKIFDSYVISKIATDGEKNKYLNTGFQGSP